MATTKHALFLTAALLTPALASAQTAPQPGDQALETLKRIKAHPSLTRDELRQSLDTMTTGSVVQAGGRSRVLYHLPASHRPLRLAGERDERRWEVQVAAQQLTGPVRFHLAYRNAVSIMPEASHLALEINGKQVAQKPISSPARTRVLAYDVPANLLLPGSNVVRLIARQRHRVACTLAATHELWTDIDPAGTGFVFNAGNAALASLSAVSAVARNKAGQVRVNIIVEPNLSAGAAQAGLALAQRVALHAGFDNPIITVSSAPGSGPGIDIYTGPRAEFETLAPAWAEQWKRGAPLQVLARDGIERLAVVLETNPISGAGGIHAQLDSAFAKARPADGAGSDLANKRLLSGKEIRFADIGLNGEEFDGRLYRNGFDVSLPADYFSADYDSAELNLTAGYGAGLLPNSRMLIRVNGTTVAGIALGRRDGHLFHNKMVRLPLSNFRPGRNRIEIEAQVANSSDADCDPRRQIEDTKRFLISGRSTIRLPKLARLTRLPDLGLTMASGYPYLGARHAAPLTLAVAQADFDHLSAAATVTTRIALSAGKPLPFSLRFGAPGATTKNAIVIGAYQQLPVAVTQNIPGIEQATIETAWHQPLDGFDMFTTASIGTPRTTRDVAPELTPARSLQRSNVQNGVDDDALLERWSRVQQDTEQPLDDERLDIAGQFMALGRSLFDRDTNHNGTGETTGSIDAKDSHFVVNQRAAPNDPDGVWTVITARDAATLNRGAALLTRPDIMTQVRGETIAIDTIDRTVTSAIVTAPSLVVRDWSAGNLKRIVAGWFSNHHFIFSALLLGTLIGIASLSSLVLRRSGVASGENCRRD